MYIPVLMYHDVVLENSPSINPAEQVMMSMYNISTSQFEEQMRVLAEMGYECPSLANISDFKAAEKIAILTFDDGLIGNYNYVLPALKKYGFYGNFFVTTGTIGTDRFMSWEQLSILVKEGMYVQSHTESHQSLEILDRKSIQVELANSKKILEGKLGVPVNGISFPHGSYNREVIALTMKEEYNIICTSDVTWETFNSFRQNPVVLGRIAIKTNIDILSFRKIITGSKVEYLKHKLIKSTKSNIKRLIGVQMYRKIYRYIFKIKKEEK